MLTTTIQRTIATTLSGAAIAGTLGAPAASAMPIDPLGTPGQPGDTQIVPPTPRPDAPAAVVVTAPDAGFDLSSAALGAAAAPACSSSPSQPAGSHGADRRPADTAPRDPEQADTLTVAALSRRGECAAVSVQTFASDDVEAPTGIEPVYTALQVGPGRLSLAVERAFTCAEMG